MTKKEIERKYGKTKLDHALSYFCMAFEKILEFLSIIFVPLLVVQQTVLYGENHPDVVLAALSIVTALVIVIGALVIKHNKK
ncbi:hypothetical protein [Lactobacillus crispatus]|uniref:hypothetical protein n=1 Tax=Lactobacillus crispatus TaxID=47770 RepID=UPI0029C2377F|nr:hypothetical protein [Lactobacillus crispatus]MDX5121330.1 hypothetical protein [Lactobacillus crispatus]